jgi:hypothetical protein
MNAERVEQVARAVMYEGYMLYPYTAAAVKNQHRWNFGIVYPPGYDIAEMQTECLAQAGAHAVLTASIRFLELERENAVERRIDVEFAAGAEHVLREFAHAEVRGEIEISAESAGTGLVRFRIRIRNQTPFEGGSRDAALARSMISLHTILTLKNGEFVSLMDPPDAFREAAQACRNIGTWPVLAGTEGERDTMLSAPIILYDYPQIAPESRGDLFDGTEIDEILTLRILTLSDEEKAAIRGGDPRAREVLERAEALPAAHLAKLHGGLRGMGRRPDYQPGARVRLRPRRSADILDIALNGKHAIVEAVEQDLEGHIHLAVVLEDDPGRDLGMMRQPGHRFFFGPEEVEPLE